MFARFAHFLTVLILFLSLAGQGYAVESFAVAVRSSEPVAPLEKDLRAVSVLAGFDGESDAPVRDVIAAARSDYTRMIERLYALGYYAGSVRISLDGIEAALIDPFAPPASVRDIRVTIATGPLFTFGNASIGPLPDAVVLADEFNVGRPAEAGIVRAAVATVIDAWREQGYPKARVSRQDVIADHASRRLLVDIAIEPGEPAVIGQAVITGESKVRPDRIRAIAGLPGGERFSPDPIEKAANRLRRTGTFQSVRVIEADAIGDDGTLDFELNVVDRKPRRIGAGIEYSTVDGIAVSGYWLHRNFLRGAERLRIEALISQLAGTGSAVDYDLSARFEKPAVLGPDTQLFAEGRLSYEDEPDFLSRKIEFEAGLSRQITDRLNGTVGIGTSYSEVLDRFSTPATWRQLRLVTLPTSLTYDRRDDPLDAKRGIFLSGGYTPFFDTVQNDAGHHFTLDARGYRPVGSDERVVLAGRLNAGWMIGPDAVDAPPDFLFYSGGGGTVRGQPYNALGADYGGLTLGGRSFAAVSGEVRFSATDTIGVVALADIGFVGPDDFSAGDWHAGAGLGLRYKTPVGPIRLDVTGPVAGTTGAGLQIYVGIGQAF